MYGIEGRVRGSEPRTLAVFKEVTVVVLRLILEHMHETEFVWTCEKIIRAVEARLEIPVKSEFHFRICGSKKTDLGQICKLKLPMRFEIELCQIQITAMQSYCPDLLARNARTRRRGSRQVGERMQYCQSTGSDVDAVY